MVSPAAMKERKKERKASERSERSATRAKPVTTTRPRRRRGSSEFPFEFIIPLLERNLYESEA